jgi:hypothetical protein
MLGDQRTWRDWWRPMQDGANLVAAPVIRDAVRSRPGGGIARRRSRTRLTFWRRRSPAKQDRADLVASSVTRDAGRGRLEGGVALRRCRTGPTGGGGSWRRCRTVAVSLDAAATFLGAGGRVLGLENYSIQLFGQLGRVAYSCFFIFLLSTRFCWAVGPNLSRLILTVVSNHTSLFVRSGKRYRKTSFF